MAILIAFATKYGFTRVCAEKLAEHFAEDVELCDLAERQPDPQDYEKIIVGGSVYAGKIRKPVAMFCTRNLGTLHGKKLGLFVCGMAEGEAARQQLESVFPPELLQVAVSKEILGGGYDFGKMNLLERIIIKKISGSGQNRQQILEENLSRMARQMQDA